MIDTKNHNIGSNYNCYIGQNPRDPYIKKSKSDAIKYYICKILNSAVDQDGKVFISSNKIKPYLNKVFYLLELKITKFNFDDKTAKSSNEVMDVYSDTLENLIDKYLNNYEYKDNSSLISKRKSIHKKVLSLANETLKEIGKSELNNGFRICTSDWMDSFDEFYNGLTDWLPIIYCDAWKFTNNRARDENEYEKYNEMFGKVFSTLKNKIKESGLKGTIDYGDDWDEGTIDYVEKL